MKRGRVALAAALAVPILGFALATGYGESSEGAGPDLHNRWGPGAGAGC